MSTEAWAIRVTRRGGPAWVDGRRRVSGTAVDCATGAGLSVDLLETMRDLSLATLRTERMLSDAVRRVDLG
jgi:hypothetical protein